MNILNIKFTGSIIMLTVFAMIPQIAILGAIYKCDECNENVWA